MGDSEIVLWVLQHRQDYYAVLGVTRNATDAEIKASYHRRALYLHPDKNKHPRAEEAFKMVQAAYTVLSNSEKRRVYDRYGAAGVQAADSTGDPHAYQRQQQQRNGRGHGMQPEDFFPFFAHHFQQGPRAQEEAHPQVPVNLVLLIPLLILIVLSSALSTSISLEHRQPPNIPKFSLSPRPEESIVHPRNTKLYEFPELRVTYYVGPDFFEKQRQRSLDIRVLELAVLREQRDSLERRCHADSIRRRLRRERSSFSPVCEEYERYRDVP